MNPEYVPVAEGVQVALHCLTEPSERHKPPVLFVHATGFGARTYAPFTQRLAEHFTVWAPDLRGHGWSEAPADGDYLWTTLAADLLAVVEHLVVNGEITSPAASTSPIGSPPSPPAGGTSPTASTSGTSPAAGTQINCVGHSIGAATLLLAEVQQPGLIANMYGYEPVVWRTEEVFQRDENPLIAGAERRREVFSSRAEAMLRFASRPPFAQVRADALHSYIEDGFEDLANGTIRLRCRAAVEADTYRGEYVSTTDQIAGCALPAVIGKGGDFTYGDIGVPAHEALPNSRLVTYEGLGHFGPLQAPDRIADDAIAALAGRTS